MGPRGVKTRGAEPIRSYQLALSRAATLELFRALGVRDEPLPRRFGRSLLPDPTVYMDVRRQGVLLWQYPLSGRQPRILPLRIEEHIGGVRLDVLAPRMGALTRNVLIATVLGAPVLVFFGGFYPLIPLIGGILCGLWLQYRDQRAMGLERMLEDHLAPLDRDPRRHRRRSFSARDLLSSTLSAPLPLEPSG